MKKGAETVIALANAEGGVLVVGAADGEVDGAFPRSTTDPGRMGGVPRARDLRFAVATVVVMVAEGMTVEDILG